MKRGDMDPARGILWSVIAGALLWGAGFMSSAFARDVWACGVEHDGTDPLSCPGSAWWQAEETFGAYAAWACRGGSAVAGAPFTDCVSGGGSPAWRFAENLQAGDLIASYGDLFAVEEFAFFDAGEEEEEPPPGDCAEAFDVSCLDFNKASGAFSVGFIAIAMFWGLGKGVGALLSMFKGRY